MVLYLFLCALRHLISGSFYHDAGHCRQSIIVDMFAACVLLLGHISLNLDVLS